MNPPTAGQLKAALDALRNDAEKWDECAGTIRGAEGAAGGFQIDAFSFSFLGDSLGVTEAYEELRAKMAELLKSGGEVTSGVAEALREVANTYEAEEERGVHRMKQVW